MINNNWASLMRLFAAFSMYEEENSIEVVGKANKLIKRVYASSLHATIW